MNRVIINSHRLYHKKKKTEDLKTINRHKRQIIKKQNVSNYIFRKILDIIVKTLAIIQNVAQKNMSPQINNIV